jgi:hypothetical protein
MILPDGRPDAAIAASAFVTGSWNDLDQIDPALGEVLAEIAPPRTAKPHRR